MGTNAQLGRRGDGRRAGGCAGKAGNVVAIALAVIVAGVIFVVQALLARHRMSSEAGAYEPLFTSPDSNASGG